MDNLEKLLDKFVGLESGIELTHDLNRVSGVIADIVYNPHNKMIAYQFLAAPRVMANDRIHVFTVHDFLYQKDKGRLVIRSDSGKIYVIRPVEGGEASSVVAYHPLSSENKEIVHTTLVNAVMSE